MVPHPGQSSVVSETPVPTPITQCPKCNGIGKPFHIQTKVGSVILHFRCARCGAEWERTKPEESSPKNKKLGNL
jgi:hypothetical protein